MSASVSGSADQSLDGEYFRAIQLYLTYEQYGSADWGGYDGVFFDIQIRLDTVNYEGLPENFNLNDTMIGDHRFDVKYGQTVLINGNAVHYLFVLDEPAVGIENLDLEALLDFVVTTNNAATGRADDGLWLYQVATWIEPISGSIDATISAPVLELNGDIYGGSLAPTEPPAPQPEPEPAPTPTIDLLVSASPDRSASGDLEAATLDGDAFVFLEGSREARKVEFFLNDPGMAGAPARVDETWRHDFADTSGEMAAAWDTRALVDGEHAITARATFSDGRIATVTDRFIIDNAVGAERIVTIRAAGTGRASGDPDDAPRFEVLIDGVSLETFGIENPVKRYTGSDALYQDYTVHWDGDAPDEVAIRFVNDGQVSNKIDKNLYVDRISVNGSRLEAEDYGRYEAANREPLATEGMWWNGTMIFDDLLT